MGKALADARSDTPQGAGCRLVLCDEQQAATRALSQRGLGTFSKPFDRHFSRDEPIRDEPDFVLIYGVVSSVTRVLVVCVEAIPATTSRRLPCFILGEPGGVSPRILCERSPRADAARLTKAILGESSS